MKAALNRYWPSFIHSRGVGANFALAFGAYDVFAGTLVTSSTVISVTCTLTGPSNTVVPYTVSLSTGSGTYVLRAMLSGANVLNYNLYTTVGRTTVWGDGTGSTATVAGSLSLTTANRVKTGTQTVFGAVPALQDAKVGVYADNVTTTVTY
jgi:spore coat protein U-like protein